MYKAAGKPKDTFPAVIGLGSSAQWTPPQAGRDLPGTPPKTPTLASRRPVVPPLKPEHAENSPVVSSPDIASPLSSPARSPSPRKALRSLSEKASAVKTRVEDAVSPRARTARMLDGVEWTDFGELPAPARALSPEPSPSRKRKAESHDERREAKKVRFDALPRVDRDKGSTSVPVGSYTKQIDQLVEELGRPTRAPMRPKTPAPTELTPIALVLKNAVGAPSLRKRDRLDLPVPALPPAAGTPSGKKPGSDTVSDPAILLKPSLLPAERHDPRTDAGHVSSASPDSLPFAPDRLGKLAIKQRKNGKEWVGKATGESLAAKLQGTLDTLQADNGGRIDKQACGYLQEMFGLLPAGVNKAGKTFNYMLMKSFYSLGLNDAQWNAIEQLHKDFDRLDTRRDPQGSAALKAQLGEIVSAKKGLVYLKREAEAGAQSNVDS